MPWDYSQAFSVYNLWPRRVEPNQMKTNSNSIHHTNPTDLGILGILAIPLRELRDFNPRFIAGDKPHVLSRCPLCLEPPPLGEGPPAGVRVDISTDRPPVLVWRCATHRGGFDGIFYELLKRQKNGKVSNLRIEKKVSIRKLDKDPVADHQDAYKCSAPRRITHYFKTLGRAQSTNQPCKQCGGCRAGGRRIESAS